MTGIELTPSKPPMAYPLATREEMTAAFAAVTNPDGDHRLLGNVERCADGHGGFFDRISVNRGDGGPPAEARVGDGKSLVVEVSGVWALTDEEIAARYGT